MNRAQSNRILFLALLAGMSFLLFSCGPQNGKTPSTSTSSTGTGGTTLPSPQTSIPSSPIPLNSTVAQTPVPTLADNEIDDYILALIQNPGDCSLPCWWGIEPGISTYQEVKDFMAHLGYDRFYIIPGDAQPQRFDLESQDIIQWMTVDRDAELITNIGFVVEGFYNPEGFASTWKSYSPEAILFQYGPPSRIDIYLPLTNLGAPGTNNEVEFGLWLFYDQRGFLVEYSGVGIFQNDRIHICPQFSNLDASWEVRFYLQSPVSLTPLEQLVDGYQSFLNHSLPIEAATGLSIDQFMGLARGEFTCLDTPLSAWRVP